MKFFHFFLLCLFFLSSKAKSEILPGLIMETQVISNKYNESVPSGTFAIRGHVYEMYGMSPILGVMIANALENPFVLTDSAGYFEMLFSIKDTTIYCYKEGWNEIIFNGEFKNRHVMDVNFYLTNPNVIQIVAKPVIYAYNSPDSVHLSFQPKGKTTFSYPLAVNNEWHIRSADNGCLINLSDGKKYPYLFWEGTQKNLTFNTAENAFSGYLIKTDTCVSFLENTLIEAGLNEKERTDFITFWGPQLIQKPFAAIQFLTEEEFSGKISALQINPAPETLLRIYMMFIPLDSADFPLTMIKPAIPAINRNGFTIVEWGGSVLQIPKYVN